MSKYMIAAEAIEMMDSYAFRLAKLGMREASVILRAEKAALMQDVMESELDCWLDEPHKLSINYDAILPSTLTWRQACEAIAQLESIRNHWIVKAMSTK